MSDQPQSDQPQSDQPQPSEAVRQLLLGSRVPTHAELALAALTLLGWQVDRVSLYDDEGVEGWRWTSAGGQEYVEVGDWYELPLLPTEAESVVLNELSRAHGLRWLPV